MVTLSDQLWDALSREPGEALPLVQRALANGDWEDEDMDGRCQDSPLHAAARTQTPQVIEAILDKGATIDVHDKFGLTPLMNAVSHGKLENVKYLLQRGADATWRPARGESVLELAVANERLEIVEALLDHGVDVNTSDRNGGNVLLTAIMIDNDRMHMGGVELVQVVDAPSEAKPKIMQLLVDRGIQIDARHVDGATNLHTACTLGELDSVRFLLDAGADPNAMDDAYRKPLWSAVRGNYVEIVKLLLLKTTNIDDPVYNGPTCLSTACRWGHRESVRLLLDAGAEIWPQEPNPKFIPVEKRLPRYAADAMYWATDEDSRDHEVVRMILETGAKRPPETTGMGEFADWLEVWERAVPDELQGFVNWISRRLDKASSPELEALRNEITDGVYAMEEEKRAEVGRAIGKQIFHAEEKETSQTGSDEDNEAKDENAGQ